MGYTTKEIDYNDALEICSKGEVVSASDVSYFDCRYWENRVINAQISDDKIIDKLVVNFTLFNGDFVEIEV